LRKKRDDRATGNIYTGLHEFSDMGFLLHFLRKDDRFADVGANVGTYTVLAAGVIGANCIAVEPLPQTFGALQRNISINHIESIVEALNIGLGAEKGKLFFTKDFDTENHIVLNNAGRKGELIEIPIDCLDNIIASDKIPALIKIDVEGFEQDVINGALTILERNELKAIIIELNGSGARYGYSEEAIHRQLLSYGFCPFIYEPFEKKLTAINGFGAHNTIYIRDFDFVHARVTKAPRMKIFSEYF
jgi:FkbM family methyltransferase